MSAQYASQYTLQAFHHFGISMTGEQLQITAIGLAVGWWVFWLSLVIVRDLDPGYVATPIMLSLFIMFAAGFHFIEYLVVLLPGIMCFWELLGDK